MISVGHLTGSKKIIKNNFFSDMGYARPSRTIGEMFFQPYESKEEFIYCARHTFTPIISVGWVMLDPVGFISFMLSVCSVIFFSAVVGVLLAGLGFEEDARYNINIATTYGDLLSQAFIDVVLLPLSALVMLTRGISTALEAAGCYEEVEDLGAYLRMV